jgi:hypothetical protein
MYTYIFNFSTSCYFITLVYYIIVLLSCYSTFFLYISITQIFLLEKKSPPIHTYIAAGPTAM